MHSDPRVKPPAPRVSGPTPRAPALDLRGRRHPRRGQMAARRVRLPQPSKVGPPPSRGGRLTPPRRRPADSRDRPAYAAAPYQSGDTARPWRLRRNSPHPEEIPWTDPHDAVPLPSSWGSAQNNRPSSGTRAEHRPLGALASRRHSRERAGGPTSFGAQSLLPVGRSQEGRAFGPIDLKAGETPALPGGACRHLGAVGVADDFPDRR